MGSRRSRRRARGLGTTLTIAMEVVPDIGVIFGYVWAGLMFFSAALNLLLVFSLSVRDWAAFMSAWGLGSKLGLFLIQYATMRIIGVRRRRAELMPA